jgi:hypothetical protein
MSHAAQIAPSTAVLAALGAAPGIVAAEIAFSVPARSIRIQLICGALAVVCSPTASPELTKRKALDGLFTRTAGRPSGTASRAADAGR